MKVTNKLLGIVDRFNIFLYHVPMPTTVLGYYHVQNHRNYVVINESIIDNTPLYNSVLAEEIGHFFTVVGEIIPSTHTKYSERIHIDKYENYASKWACEYLIDNSALVNYLNGSNELTYNAIAEYFSVVESVVIHKFLLLSKISQFIKISDSKTLCLTALPSLYFLEML